MNLFGITIDVNALFEAFGNNAVTNAIGLVGGLLGAVAFLLQLPRKLRPILLGAESIEIHLGSDMSTIEKIKTDFTLYNKSNQNLLVTDIFVKIYENNKYTPEDDIYHATSAVIDGSTKDFTALVVGPNGSEVVTIELSENLPGRSKKRIDKNGQYSFEIYAVLNNRKIVKFPRIDTFSVREQKETIIRLTSLMSYQPDLVRLILLK